MRLMGIDFGNKRIGVALSDPLGITAFSHTVIHRTNLEEDLQRIGEIILTYSPALIVLGLPKNMNNSIGPQGELTLAFGELLQSTFALRVVFWDERLSTVAADRILRESKPRGKSKKGDSDMIAAALILESYMNSEKKEPKL